MVTPRGLICQVFFPSLSAFETPPGWQGHQAWVQAALQCRDHALCMRVERTFAWEDKFKRLLLRFERIQQRHYAMKLRAYTLMNLRAFCGI